MSQKFSTLFAFLLLNSIVIGQIPSGSFDLGLSGYYNASPLSITQGGSGIGGNHTISKIEGNLGYFFMDNAVAGFRIKNEHENLSVNSQFYNQTTGGYDPYIMIDKTLLYGVYGRYYSDLSPMFSAFGHVEYNKGTSLISVTEEDDLGNIIQMEYPRDLEDFSLGLGLCFKPYPNLAIEALGLRRTRFESYIPQGSTSGVLQIETYLGYEFRIGIRFFLNTSQMVNSIRDRKHRMPIGPGYSK